jgi:hypothetical protein
MSAVSDLSAIILEELKMEPQRYKYYNVYEVGTGKKIGWTQDSPLGPVYDAGENIIGRTTHKPGSSQVLFDAFPGKLGENTIKVNIMPDQHR